MVIEDAAQALGASFGGRSVGLTILHFCPVTVAGVCGWRDGLLDRRRADTGLIEAQEWCHVLLSGEDATALWRRSLAISGYSLAC